MVSKSTVLVLVLFALWWVALTGVSGCGGESTPEQPAAADPRRCELMKLGEAADLIESGKVPDDQLVEIEGIADPRTLVWKDQQTGNIYYLTRVMGAQQRLYYTEQLAVGEAPKNRTRFVGHLQRWDTLEQRKAAEMSNALLTEYKLEVDPGKTYLLTGGGKPAGCP